MAHIIDETIELDGKNNIIYGGDDTPYEKFLEWTVKDNIPETTIKNIAKKTAYVHTTVNLDWSDLPEYTNLFSTIWYSTLGYGSATVKNLLEMLMKKNVLLATLFKRIDYIGFLVDSANPNKTESDDLIIQRNKANKKNIKISWGLVDSTTFLSSFSEIFELFRGGGFEFLKGFAELGKAILKNAPIEYFAGSIAYLFSIFYKEISEKTYTLLGSCLRYIHTLIEYLQLDQIEFPTFLSTPYGLLITILNGSWNMLLTGGQGIVTSLVGSNAALYILAFIFIINLVAWFFKDNITNEQIMNNAVVNQIYTMVRDIKVFEVENLNINPCTLFGNLLSKSQKNVLDMLPQIIIYENVVTPSQYPILKIFEGVIPKDISITSSTSKNSIVVNKEKLINVEIPLTAFYYALLNTRSTYPKELAGDLKEYNQNKDAFMLKLKKKREKNT